MRGRNKRSKEGKRNKTNNSNKNKNTKIKKQNKKREEEEDEDCDGYDDDDEKIPVDRYDRILQTICCILRRLRSCAKEAFITHPPPRLSVFVLLLKGLVIWLVGWLYG